MEEIKNQILDLLKDNPTLLVIILIVSIILLVIVSLFKLYFIYKIILEDD